MKFVLLAVIFCSIASTVKGGCEDRLVGCPAFVNSCGLPLVFRNCQRTCNLCGTDLCSVSNGGCEQLCSWDGETAQCSCESGYRVNERNQFACEDIDECNEGPNPCLPYDQHYCINLVGSFTCELSNCHGNDNNSTINYYRSGRCCTLKNSTCGLTDNIRRFLPEDEDVEARIVGGRRAQLGQWPWQGQLVFQHSAHCGASLITNKWLIGAAHCFTESSYTKMFVYLGHVRNAMTERLVVDQREQRRIRRVIIHENYDNNTNDIALIELDRPVQFNSSIRPICLPCGEFPQVGDKCWATGFGKTSETDENSIPDFLQEVDVPIVDGNECVRSFQDDIPIDPELMMCAGYEQGGKDACMGDSGGPLACQRHDSCEWYLAGVTSFGSGCGRPGYYGVYVNMVNYEDWIRENLGEEAPPRCTTTYSRCRFLNDVFTDCRDRLGQCEEFPHFMGINCARSCCQLAEGEIRNCFDHPRAGAYCQMQKALGACINPAMQHIVSRFCQNTCEFC